MTPAELMTADVALLGALSGEELRSTFLRALDAFEGDELDRDRLPLLGMRLAAAGHAALDVACVAWASSSAARLEIASNLLVGMWREGGAGTRITPAALERLIAAHDALAPGEDVEYPYLLALSEAAEWRRSARAFAAFSRLRSAGRSRTRH